MGHTQNWETIWNTRPNEAGREDYFRQVWKTVGGNPLTEDQFRSIITEIVRLLELQPDDFVLDLCCGNGLITKEIASRCKQVIGIDFSQPLIDIAREYHVRSNVAYERFSVLDFNGLSKLPISSVNKVLCYDALQFFDVEGFKTVLENLIQLTSNQRLILIGGILDKKRKENYFNSTHKRILGIIRRMAGKDLIGKWWEKEEVESLCRNAGLHCVIHDQDPQIYNSHFRFDATIF